MPKQSVPTQEMTNPDVGISAKKHLANIANALLSTGPKNEAGKVRAAMNALKSGL